MTTPAILASTSQKVASKPERVGTVSHRLDEDRRNTVVWVPIAVNYGSDADPPLIIGFDAEWKNLGEINRILSYQTFSFSADGNSWPGIVIAEGRRLRLPQLIAAVLKHGLGIGTLKAWPRRVYLVSHFSLADCVAFSDFDDFKAEFDSVRRTLISIRKPLSIVCWDTQRHEHRILVTLRDSMLLAPAGKQALKQLGKLVGIEKLDLENDEIEHMDELLEFHGERFEEYALRDPKICVAYVNQIMALNQQITGKAEIPPTLSSVGVNMLLRHWKEHGFNENAVLGTELVTEKKWSEPCQRSIRRQRTVPTEERRMFESFGGDCYHGGRNEQFIFGAGTEGVWTDYDMCGAYTTAMALIGMPDWRAIRHTRDLDEFQPHVMGFARVQFKFPDNTRFPCLPVRTAHGLVFPLAGISYCCAPEVYLAQGLGAQVEILNGVILPASSDHRPFESFIVACASARRSHEKGSLFELFWKELGNSTYGKTAQGLMEKRCFDSRSGKHVNLPPSRITCAYFAGYTTSLVRATLGEILARLPLHVDVCNATTDGLLSTATDAEVEAATQGPICRLFASARIRICGNPTILESKHRIAQPLGYKTRGQGTLKPIEGEKIVLAKTGLKAPRDLKDEAAQNQWIIETFINRTADSKQAISVLRNLPEIWKNGGDLVPKTIERRINMDYDFKRKPISPSMRPINGVDHLYFDTEPWGAVEEFGKCRDAWDSFQAGRRVMKTLNDMADFTEYQAAPRVQGIQRPGRNAAVTLAKRMFLRAYVRSAWGLDAKAVSYSALARWLTAGGFPTTKEDVENARRPNAKLVERLVVRHCAVDQFITLVQSEFPSFEAHNLIAP